MPRRYVSELADGDNVDEVFLVGDRALRANRNGNQYIQVDLRDRTGGIGGRIWNAGEPLFRTFNDGDFVLVRGKVQLFQGSLQMIVSTLETVSDGRIDLNDFLPHTTQDIGKLLEKLRVSLRKVGNVHLKALAECYLIDDDFLKAFCRAPAGVKVHHAYVGGLLEHVVTMMDVAEKIAPLYPDVDRDLLVTGVFLHDAGKVRELTFARSFAYSDEGQLLGHLAIGLEMLHDKVRKAGDLTGEPFPRELLLRLKHMILSHHGSSEFGSPKVPMTPEAVALHAIDTLDSRITICVREIKDDRGPSAWTPYNNAMQRKLFKGGGAGALDSPAEDD